MPAHTPGPWALEQWHPCTVTANVRGVPVCTTYAEPGERPTAECEANARLIAAAPEMLDLLTRAQAAFFGDGTRKALLPVMQEIAAFRRERAK